MQRPGEDDLALVGQAVTALRRGAGPARHPSASAVRAAEGTVVTALTLRDAVCSDLAAVAAALSRGLRVVTLATVRHLDADATRVTAPCASCRAALLVHAPALRVLHLADGLRVSRVGDLP